MNCQRLITRMLAGAVFVTIMTACQKDLYKPEPPEHPEVEIDWSTQKTTRLDVDVNDAYAGRYYYTVGVYLSNPAVDTEAKMIAGSGQKTNSKVAYSRELVLPDLTETIYISVIDPYKRRRIYAAEVEGQHVSFRAGAGVVTKGDAVETRAASITEVDYSYAGKAYVELSGSTAVRIQTGTTYVIKKGSAFSGSMDFPGEGNFSLYVEGELIWNGSAATLQKESKIYVLNGGVVKNLSGIRELSLIGNSQIAVQQGGSFGMGDAGTGFTFVQLTNSSRIINEGTMTVNNIPMNSSASLANAGTFTCAMLRTENTTNAIVNTHYLKAESISLNNASMVNDCMMEVGTFTVVSNGGVVLAPGAYIETKTLTAHGLTMDMGAQSMWKGEKAAFSGQVSLIRGTGDDYALFKVDEITASGWQVITYDKRVEIECKSHTQPKGIYDKLYILSNGATFAVGQASADIPGSDCNGQGGNDNDGDGDGDTDPDFEEGETMPYTYLFEDNWPSRGDYDMNDVVMSVEIRNVTRENKASGVHIIVDLLAVGATKKLGAGFQLDGIAAAKVSGSESGQDYAVIPLFTDAHAELGAPVGAPANTYDINYASKRIEKEITFTSLMDNSVDNRNFNLFIVVDGNGFNEKERSEVHVAGFTGTKLAKTSEKSTRNYVDVETGWMWALAIPQIDFATYPMEGVQLNNAYEGFTEWVAGSGVPGWYMNPVDGKVIYRE